MDLDQLPAPPVGEDDKARRDCLLYGSGFVVDGRHVPPSRVRVIRDPAAAAHVAAERALLEAAVRHAKAKQALRERGGVLTVRNEAAAAHMALDRAALAYADAHAALVAES